MAKKKPEGEEIIQSTVRLTRSLWRELNHRCVDLDMSMQEGIVKAIQEFVAKKGGRS